MGRTFILVSFFQVLLQWCTGLQLYLFCSSFTLLGSMLVFRYCVCGMDCRSFCCGQVLIVGVCLVSRLAILELCSDARQFFWFLRRSARWVCDGRAIGHTLSASDVYTDMFVFEVLILPLSVSRTLSTSCLGIHSLFFWI